MRDYSCHKSIPLLLSIRVRHRHQQLENFMTLLAIELSSLKPDAYIPIIIQTLQTVESRLYIVVFLTPDFLPKLDSPAKRAGLFHPLQELISALYICTASKTETPC